MSLLMEQATCRHSRHSARLLAFKASAAAVVIGIASGSALAVKPGGGFATPENNKRLADQATIHEQLNQAMSLRDSDLVTIESPQQPGDSFIVQFVHDGQVYTLDAAPWSIRTENYKVLAQVEDGSFVDLEPGIVKTFRGTVWEIPGSDAAGSFQEDGLWAMIVQPNGVRIWIEPAWRMDAALAGTGLHVVFSDLDQLPVLSKCGTLIEDIPPAPPGGGDLRGGLACGTGLCFAELGNDADVEYFNFWGSESAVEDRINTVVAAMNVQYERDVDITHVITAIIIRTAEPDPYSTTNSDGLVNQVQAEWTGPLSSIPHDIAQLFTAKQIDGSTIGQADSIGGVCSAFSYSYSQSDCCGSFARTVELHAHENGHVWNGIHCSCPGFTMMTPLNNNPLLQFSPNNITRIESHRDIIGCLGTSAGLSLPFFDDFNIVAIDSDNWTQNVGADVNGDGNGEPSAPTSLNIDGADSLTSNFIDLEPQGVPPTVKFSYWWQRTGSGNSPEAGEDLFVEYLNDQNQWIILRQHAGDGPDGDPFQFEELILPAGAKHSFFRIRFRGVSGNTGFDDWFIDDVLIEEVITPEDNDLCGSNVIDVTEGNKSFDTTNAGTEVPGEASCGGQIENDIWYRYIPSCSGDVTLGICDADFDARIAIYFVLCPFSPDTAIACDDNSCAVGEAEVTINVSAGSTYWIRIGAAVNGVSGTGTLTIQCDSPVTGACCMPDGSCTTETSADCATNGGTYQGDGITCGAANCPQPTGACCMPDGSCTTETSADCATNGGTYQGDGVTCGAANCPQPCPADIADSGGPNPDSQVNVFDLLELLENWGTSGNGADIAPPNNIVDVFDLLDLLEAWGTCL